MIPRVHSATVLVFNPDLGDHARSSFLTELPGSMTRYRARGPSRLNKRRKRRIKWLVLGPWPTILRLNYISELRGLLFLLRGLKRAHMVAGFGQIHWDDGSAASTVTHALFEEGEAEIVAYMNDDHSSVRERYTCDLFGLLRVRDSG